MKKILILAYDFPPYVSVGGLRPYSWYKHFREFGLDPVVITRQWGNKYGNHLDYIAPSDSDKTIIEKTEFGTIIRTPYVPNMANRIMLKHGEKKFRLIRKAISAFYEFAQFLLPVGSKARIYKEAQQYLKTYSVDAIIATGEPFVLFKYASKLSKKHKTPWIADYRDPWVQNKNRSQNIFLYFINTLFEKKALSNVTLITTVSSILVKQISSLITNKPFYIMQNGYVTELQKVISGITQQTQNLAIGFAGTIYDWHPWRIFLQQCFEFMIHQNRVFTINFYGVNTESEINEFIREGYPSFTNQVRIHPRMPNHLLVKELASNNILLLFNDYSILGTKIFDYLAVKRKILLCFSDDINAKKLKANSYCITELDGESKHLQADLIYSTSSGIIVRDSEHLLEVLKELYAELQEKGFIECNSVNVEQYSRKKQTEKLAELIKNVVNII